MNGSPTQLLRSSEYFNNLVWDSPFTGPRMQRSSPTFNYFYLPLCYEGTYQFSILVFGSRRKCFQNILHFPSISNCLKFYTSLGADPVFVLPRLSKLEYVPFLMVPLDSLILREQTMTEFIYSYYLFHRSVRIYFLRFRMYQSIVYP